MTATLRLLLPVFVLALLAPPILAQSLNDPMLEGAIAFREERFSDAAQAFQRAVEANPDNAEAHFLLARIYFETPLKDVKRAGRELDRAMDLDRDNVRYMVARLQQLRSQASNFLVDKIRESKRRELARSILERDSVNAFAHEEFGIAYIRDFWKYRNALMLPNVDFNRYGGARTAIGADDDLFQIEDELVLEDDAGFIATSEGGDPLQRFNLIDPNAVFLADEFDVETLQAMGAPVSDLSGRAMKAYDRAIGHLNQSLDTDPRHRTVYDYLMEIYALKGEWADALTMLQQMYVYFPDDPDLWTYLGLAHYRNGNPDAASKAFESALGDMDERTRRAYTLPDDLVPVGDKDAYKADPTAYSTQFWSSKDPRFLTPYNERKLEHYSRLTYAELLYRSEPLNLRGWDTERGRILVRYGVPQGDITIVPFGRNSFNRAATPSSTPGGVSDPAESEAVQAGRFGTDFDPFEDTNTFNIWDYGDFRFVFEDPFRTGEYRMFSPGANDVSAGALPWINDYAILAQETFREYPERYEYESPARQVDLPFLVSAFKGRDGNADLFVNYGIPVNDGPDSSDLLDITAKFGTFVIGANRDILSERRRTIYGLRGEQVVTFEEQNLWVDSEILSVPPGDADVSVEFETASGGTVGVQRRSVKVPDFSTNRLALSDLLLAYRVEETDDGRALAASDVVRNGLSIMPAPWSVFSTAQPIYLYFEVYGLERSPDGQARYEVEAALVPREDGSRVGNFVRGLFGGGGAGVSVRLPVTVEAQDDGQYLIMDASNQETGLYTIQFRVRDLISGRSVTSEQDLFLE